MKPSDREGTLTNAKVSGNGGLFGSVATQLVVNSVVSMLVKISVFVGDKNTGGRMLDKFVARTE